jgi:hypothetical protein
MTPEAARKTAHACPRCGGDNRCAMAAGEAITACWCIDIRIDEQLLPGAGSDRSAMSCLCPGCARGTPGNGDHGGRSSEG